MLSDALIMATSLFAMDYHSINTFLFISHMSVALNLALTNVTMQRGRGGELVILK
jgi:hypothetical protein